MDPAYAVRVAERREGEGNVYDETQERVGLHNRASLVAALIARADRDHADDVPCVIALPIASGHPAYLSWVYGETSQAKSTEA